MWPNPQKTADLVSFTEETFSGKLCAVSVFSFCTIDAILDKAFADFFTFNHLIWFAFTMTDRELHY